MVGVVLDICDGCDWPRGSVRLAPSRRQVDGDRRFSRVGANMKKSEREALAAERKAFVDELRLTRPWYRERARSDAMLRQLKIEKLRRLMRETRCLQTQRRRR
jgi:hypothetical protein